jgi:hypothetical protein
MRNKYASHLLEEDIANVFRNSKNMLRSRLDWLIKKE